MISNSISLSQPLHSRAYNDYLSGKAGGQQGLNPMLGHNNQNIIEEMGFASELRSQKTVSALMNLPANKQNQSNLMGETLREQGSIIHDGGTISLPQTKMTALQNNSIDEQVEDKKTQEESIIGIPLERKSSIISVNTPKEGIAINTMRSFALDGRSLNILSRIAQKAVVVAEENLQNQIAEQAVTLQNNIKPEKQEVQIGKLSAQYESASAGSVAIGYDRTGGTSYGTYQIASKTGTFNSMLQFLDEKAPEWATKLREAGEANTGSRNGTMPDVWRSLVKENPEKMRQLEHDFIVQSHYKPVENYVKENWNGEISPALKEVIFSTSVQHGVQGAKRVFEQAFSSLENQNKEKSKSSGVEGELASQSELIKNVYVHRSTKFGSSTAAVQDAVKQRFIHEQNQALKMLG